MSIVRVRATAPLRENFSDKNAKAEGSLRAGAPVEILVDRGDWLQVRELGTGDAAAGWLPRRALSFPLPEGNRLHSSISRTFRAEDFVVSGGSVDARTPDQISESGERATTLSGIRRLLQIHQKRWDEWFEKVREEGRQGAASLEEGLAVILGGRDVWVIRADQIFREPKEENVDGLAWANRKDILRWTGKVRHNDQGKFNIWYEVELFKNDKSVTGWYKGDLLEPYFHPDESNDPGVPDKKDLQFDLNTPAIHLPADPEIEEARAERRSGYQYIKINRVLEDLSVKFNLCGEFCAAALAGIDVIPLLQAWVDNFPDTASKILREDDTTGYAHIEQMLHDHNGSKPIFMFMSDSDVRPPTPMRIRDLLENGRKMMVVGVNIYTSDGRLIGEPGGTGKTTAHWVVLEDVIPAGTGGWMRIYNPFRNREEVYSCDVYEKSATKWFSGLLVDVTKP